MFKSTNHLLKKVEILVFVGWFMALIIPVFL
jgi:hypothetical protein